MLGFTPISATPIASLSPGVAAYVLSADPLTFTVAVLNVNTGGRILYALPFTVAILQPGSCHDTTLVRTFVPLGAAPGAIVAALASASLVKA